MGCLTDIRLRWRSRKQDRHERRLETQRQQDLQRQKNPQGLLEIALRRGIRRHSFTVADPGRFYNEGGHRWTSGQDAQGSSGGRIA